MAAADTAAFFSLYHPVSRCKTKRTERDILQLQDPLLDGIDNCKLVDIDLAFLTEPMGSINGLVLRLRD